MKLIANAPIGVKVALAPAFALLCLAILALSAWWSTRNLMQAFDQVSTVYVPRLQQAQELGSRFKDLQRLVMQSLSWEAAGQKADRVAELDKRIATLLREFDGHIKAAAAVADLAPQELEALQALRKQYDIYFKTALETLDIKSAGISTAASFLFTLDAAYADGTKSLDELGRFEQAQVQAAQQHLKNCEASLRRVKQQVEATQARLDAAIAEAERVVEDAQDEEAEETAVARMLAQTRERARMAARAAKGMSA